MFTSKKKTESAADVSAADPAPEATPTPPEMRELQAQAAKAAEHWDRLLRITAEFDNFRKRAARERQEAVKFANETLLEKLLPVLDNFEAALAAARGGAAENAQSLHAGVNLIQQQLRAALADAGLEEVDAAGRPFDPNLHEAVSQMESAEHPEGHVARQLRKGYRLRERLLRPATVIVAKAPSPPPAG